MQRYGGLYEHSAWIAERTWDAGLCDSDDPEALAEALAATMLAASRDEQLALIRAHPDLVGKAAIAGRLTADSSVEQSSAGLDQCSAEEYEAFQDLNARYWQRFGFPFVMAVRDSDRQTILTCFAQRLENSRDDEFDRALVEINTIARLRLAAMKA